MTHCRLWKCFVRVTFHQCSRCVCLFPNLQRNHSPHILPVLASADGHIPWTSSPLTEWLSHSAPLSLPLSTRLSFRPERERDFGWIVRSIVSVRCLLMREAHTDTESRAAIEGLIANLIVNTANLSMYWHKWLRSLETGTSELVFSGLSVNLRVCSTVKLCTEVGVGFSVQAWLRKKCMSANACVSCLCHTEPLQMHVSNLSAKDL